MTDLDKAFAAYIDKKCPYKIETHSSIYTGDIRNWKLGAKATFKLFKPVVEALESIKWVRDPATQGENAQIESELIADKALTDLRKKLGAEIK